VTTRPAPRNAGIVARLLRATPVSSPRRLRAGSCAVAHRATSRGYDQSGRPPLPPATQAALSHIPVPCRARPAVTIAPFPVPGPRRAGSGATCVPAPCGQPPSLGIAMKGSLSPSLRRATDWWSPTCCKREGSRHALPQFPWGSTGTAVERPGFPWRLFLLGSSSVLSPPRRPCIRPWAPLTDPAVGTPPTGRREASINWLDSPSRGVRPLDIPAPPLGLVVASAPPPLRSWRTCAALLRAHPRHSASSSPCPCRAFPYEVRNAHRGRVLLRHAPGAKPAPGCPASAMSAAARPEPPSSSWHFSAVADETVPNSRRRP